MLPSSTPKADHQILESTLLVIAYTRINQSHHARQELMHTILLIQILDHRRILAGQRLELFFSPRIGKAPSIKHKAATIASLIFRQSSMKRETDNADHEIIGIRR